MQGIRQKIKSMNTRQKGFGLATAFCLLLLLLCLGACSSKEDRFVKRLNAAVQAAKDRPPATIKISDCTDFDWDRLYVFGPYTPPKAIEKDIGYKWRGSRNDRLESTKGINLLVFVRQDRVTESFEVPRFTDFMDLAKKHIFSKVDAVFHVRCSEDQTKRAWFKLSAVSLQSKTRTQETQPGDANDIPE